MPKYSYPKEILMVNDLNKIAKGDKDIKLKNEELQFISGLDSQKKYKKRMYGGGFLASENAVRKAEQAKREAEQARKEEYIWTLSEREKEIVEKLG